MAVTYEIHTDGDDDYAAEVTDGTLTRAWGPLAEPLVVIGSAEPDAVRRWLDEQDSRYRPGQDQPATADLAATLEAG